MWGLVKAAIGKVLGDCPLLELPGGLNFDPRIKAIHVCILCIFIMCKSLKICIFSPKVV